jgi:hypothetical protein
MLWLSLSMQTLPMRPDIAALMRSMLVAACSIFCKKMHAVLANVSLLVLIYCVFPFWPCPELLLWMAWQHARSILLEELKSRCFKGFCKNKSSHSRVVRSYQQAVRILLRIANYTGCHNIPAVKHAKHMSAYI